MGIRLIQLRYDQAINPDCHSNRCLEWTTSDLGPSSQVRRKKIVQRTRKDRNRRKESSVRTRCVKKEKFPQNKPSSSPKIQLRQFESDLTTWENMVSPSRGKDCFHARNFPQVSLFQIINSNQRLIRQPAFTVMGCSVNGSVR